MTDGGTKAVAEQEKAESSLNLIVESMAAAQARLTKAEGDMNSLHEAEERLEELLEAIYGVSEGSELETRLEMKAEHCGEREAVVKRTLHNWQRVYELVESSHRELARASEIIGTQPGSAFSQRPALLSAEHKLVEAGRLTRPSVLGSVTVGELRQYRYVAHPAL